MNRMDSLVFKPICEFGRGNITQRCETKYRGVIITNDTHIPYGFLKEPSDTFFVWLNLPLDTVVKGGSMVQIYHDEGFGSPMFSGWQSEWESNLNKALDFIDEWIAANHGY